MQGLLFEDTMTLAEVAPDLSADHGEVFTRRWVVDFILDLAGYTGDRDLGALTLVEPSCGTGAFLIPILDRLLASAEKHGRPLHTLGESIRAYDLLDANASLARKAVSVRLQEAGLGQVTADELASTWVTTGDFLLHPHESGSADMVVGNPPYVRLESVADGRMRAYRRICLTMRGRADIYVGFFEVGLRLLKPDGVLGFICADRWMRNQYGADLRELVAGSYSVDTVVAMHDVDAFEDDVSAYPAVVMLRNRAQGAAKVIDTSSRFDRHSAPKALAWTRRPDRELSDPAFEASRLERWFDGRDLWPTGSPAQLALIADLEARFAPLQDERTGTRVGIGVATGCDEVYITRVPDLVESDRLLPLLQAADLGDGTAGWSGTYLVNPWGDDGLVDLRQYPRLEAHLSRHRLRLGARHVARKRPNAWYRTIDRVTAGLRERPKLVLPDMKAAAHPVLDEGRYYPHHNLYFVVSDAWDPEVLGGLLLSEVANLFVGAYCVKMRGGTYRFQAQYLRRIRVPEVDSVKPADRRVLAEAFADRDTERANGVAAGLYGIDASGFGRVVAR
jgi:hypothetical protein